MLTVEEIPDVVRRVRDELSAAEQRGIFLKIMGDRLDDGWLYISVEPSRPGIRASDHAGLMSKIERELRASGVDQVLLVPAIND
jgi:hypothetical protein